MGNEADALNDIMDDGLEFVEKELADEAKEFIARYEKAKEAKFGAEVGCTVCGKKFVKKHKSQAFCSNKGRGNCKDRFHNIANEERRERTLQYHMRDV